MRRIVAVIAMTLAAGGLAETTAAADPVVQAPIVVQAPPVVQAPSVFQAPPAADAHTETPLGVKPSKPLTLQEPPTSSGQGWKILALAGAAGVGLWFWKRRTARPIKSLGSTLTIVRRATVGIRSELLVVEVEGQRLLIGVTPSTIQTLATLPSAEDDAEAAALTGDDPEGVAPQLGDRFASILASARRSTAFEGGTRAAAQPAVARASVKASVTPIEGQARGLMTLGTRE